MTSIQKVDKRLQHSAHGRGAMLLGVPFVGVGGYFALAGFGAIPMPDGANAPAWVIGAVGLAFALAGLAVAGAGAAGMLRRWRLARIARGRPDEVWWSDYPWDPRGVRDSPWRRVLGAAAGFVFLLVFLAPFNWWAFASGADSWLLWIVVGTFDVAMLVAGCVFVYRLLAVVRFGATQLAFRRFPFFPGERLEVALSPNRFETQAVTLRYVEERYVTRRTSEGRSTEYQSRELWSERREFSTPGADELPIDFDLPDDAERVTQLTANPAVHYYELVIEVERAGVDFRTTFPLPVYERPFGYRAPEPGARAFEPLRAPGAGRLVAFALAGLLALAGVGFAVSKTPLLGLARAWMVLDPVADLRPSGMQAALAPDGDVWLLTKYELVRYGDGDLDAGERLVGGAGTVRAPSSMSSFLVDGANGVWLGGWHGEVWRLVDGELSVVAAREAGPRRRVHAIARHGESVYLGADRLWRVTDIESAPEPVTELPARPPQALLAGDDGVLYAGIDRALWRLRDGRWEQLWTAPAQSGRIKALATNAAGALLVGLSAGLWTVEPSSGAARVLLESVHVSAVAADGPRIWVGLWKGGILEGGGEVWRGLAVREGLPDEDVTGVVRDAGGRMWFTLYGASAVRADADALRGVLAPR